MKRLPSLLTLCITSLACLFLLTTSELKANGQAIAVKAISLETDIEPSAVEPIGNGKFLLVANDKQRHLLIVDAETGVIAGNKLLIGEATSSNPKWEAMAKDGKDYYIVGTKCSCLYRFSLENEASNDPAKINLKLESGPISIKVLRPESSQGETAAGTGEKGQTRERTIEGLAVWTNDNNEKELVFGMRDSPGKELIQVYRAKVSDRELSLLEFFAFKAKRPDEQPVEWHLSSLEYVQALNGFLVVTSTEDDGNKFYGNKLWFVSRENLKASQPNSSTGAFKDATRVMIGGQVFDSKMKAEGLTMIDGAGPKVAIVFDNDFRKTSQNGGLAVFNLSDLIQIDKPLTSVRRN